MLLQSIQFSAWPAANSIPAMLSSASPDFSATLRPRSLNIVTIYVLEWRVAHPLNGFEFSGAGPFGLEGPGFRVHSILKRGRAARSSPDFLDRTESKPRPFQDLEGSGTRKCKPSFNAEILKRYHLSVSNRQQEYAKARATRPP